jgi:hypothetical protein
LSNSTSICPDIDETLTIRRFLTVSKAKQKKQQQDLQIQNDFILTCLDCCACEIRIIQLNITGR